MYANINVEKTKGFKCQTVVLSNLAFFIIPTQNECFGGYTRISLSVRPSLCPYVCVSVCVQNTSFCQSAGGGISDSLVTALVYALLLLYIERYYS